MPPDSLLEQVRLALEALCEAPDLDEQQLYDLEYLSRVHGISAHEARHERPKWEIEALLAFRDSAESHIHPAIPDGGPDAEVPDWMSQIPTEEHGRSAAASHPNNRLRRRSGSA